MSDLKQFLAASALALALAAVGCKQGQGDRCQVDSDCDDARCVYPSSSPVTAQGGRCGVAPTVGPSTDGGQMDGPIMDAPPSVADAMADASTTD